MSNSILKAFLPKPKFQIIFSGIISLLAVAITWLISADSSPLHEFFIWNSIPNLWGMLNFIPLIFGLIVAGNPHAPSESAYIFGIIIQWFIVGFVLSILISHFFIVVRKS